LFDPFQNLNHHMNISLRNPGYKRKSSENDNQEQDNQELSSQRTRLAQYLGTLKNLKKQAKKMFPLKIRMPK